MKEMGWEWPFGWARQSSWPKQRGLPVFRVEFLKSSPGTHLQQHETFRFPGITRLSEPGSPELGPGSCIIVSAVSTGSPADPNTLQSLRADTADTAGTGGSQEAETGAANRSCESVHPCPKPCLRACSVPGLDTQKLGEQVEQGNDKTLATPSAKSTKQAAFPKVGSQESQSFKSLSE